MEYKLLGDCLLLTTPRVKFDTFLTAGYKMTGQPLSSVADSSRRELSESEKYLSCLSILSGGSGEGFQESMLNHISISVMIWASERDLLEVLQITGMPFVVNDTIQRSIQVAVSTGTLIEWKVAVSTGLTEGVTPSVRFIYEKIYQKFLAEDLRLWPDYTRKETQNGLLLEYKK